MKIWTNKSFAGHYPVGTAAVVVAETAQEAKEHLDLFLSYLGLGPCEVSQFQEMPFVAGEVRILNDGNY